MLDLNLEEEDLALDFVPAIEKRLGIKTRSRDWNTVETLGEMIDVFSKYYGNSGVLNPPARLRVISLSGGLLLALAPFMVILFIVWIFLSIINKIFTLH
ncbi:hypothetical protein [Gloeobacter morelensis]|uniref:Uncharacterized protein n=1 Tax=Gloeobacter morelensis MG652769 TaxID=2781736 RepID=A0ABY3PRR5_9CYAN|nr:hypothetical protein [Gloeobacter morelensis]UFP96418.1 hypothetical protein ISF26_09490 [Gloeobacter morelensis MG652769]